MSRLCQECGAKCCKYFCFEIDTPDSYDELDDVRWYLAHEGISVHLDEDGDWYISIMHRCKNLDANERCTDYENRPLICRKYDPEDCDYTAGEYCYQEEFHTPEQFEAYARKTLGNKHIENARDKARAKLEKKHAAKLGKAGKKAGKKRKA